MNAAQWIERGCNHLLPQYSKVVGVKHSPKDILTIITVQLSLAHSGQWRDWNRENEIEEHSSPGRQPFSSKCIKEEEMWCEKTKWHLNNISICNCFVHLKFSIAAFIQRWQNRPSFILCSIFLQRGKLSWASGSYVCVGEMVVSCCYTNVNALIQNILDGRRKYINMAADCGLFANFSLSSFRVLHHDACPKAGLANDTKVSHECFNTK